MPDQNEKRTRVKAPPQARRAPVNIDITGDHIDAGLALGHVYIGYGQPEKACIVLEALRAECPDRPLISASLGFAYLLLGQHAKALEWIDEFIRRVEMNAANAPALLIRARALRGLQRTQEADQSLERFIDARKII